MGGKPSIIIACNRSHIDDKRTKFFNFCQLEAASELADDVSHSFGPTIHLFLFPFRLRLGSTSFIPYLWVCVIRFYIDYF